jgi:tetratricopeptide (TPR) repeat protein
MLVITPLLLSLQSLPADSGLTAADLSVVLTWKPERACILPFDEMERLCTSLIDQLADADPEVVRKVYIRRAEARYRLKNYHDAEKDLARLLKANPKDSDVLWRLGRIYAVQPDGIRKASEMAQTHR